MNLQTHPNRRNGQLVSFFFGKVFGTENSRITLTTHYPPPSHIFRHIDFLSDACGVKEWHPIASKTDFAGKVIDLQSLNSCHRIKLRWQRAKFSDIFIIFIFQITNRPIQAVGNRFPTRWHHCAPITWRCVHVGRKSSRKKCACVQSVLYWFFLCNFVLCSIRAQSVSRTRNTTTVWRYQRL